MLCSGGAGSRRFLRDPHVLFIQWAGATSVLTNWCLQLFWQTLACLCSVLCFAMVHLSEGNSLHLPQAGNRKCLGVNVTPEQFHMWLQHRDFKQHLPSRPCPSWLCLWRAKNCPSFLPHRFPHFTYAAWRALILLRFPDKASLSL